MNFEKYYLLDTNILLEDARNIFKKSGYDEINFQAREFARILENSEVLSSNKYEDFKIIRLKLINQDVTIVDIISKDEYSINSKNISLNILNDRKILEVAKFAKNYYNKDIKFVSMDIMARTRAISLDIKSVALHGKDSDKFNFDFIKNIDINFEDLENLDNQDIINFDKEYKVSDFSYCLKVKHSVQVILAPSQNNYIKILDETVVRYRLITPLNKTPPIFIYAIILHVYNVLIVQA